jgi:hypothetical protein
MGMEMEMKTAIQGRAERAWFWLWGRESGAGWVCFPGEMEMEEDE